MSELGRHLKEARLQKGMSLDDVQEVTKIRKKYLEAIEAGDYKVLPGSFYVRAFIKTYAEAVGVNPDEPDGGARQCACCSRRYYHGDRDSEAQPQA